MSSRTPEAYQYVEDAQHYNHANRSFVYKIKSVYQLKNKNICEYIPQ